MIKRTPIRKVRAKPRRNRLKGADMESLRRQVFERDGYCCQHQIVIPTPFGDSRDDGRTFSYQSCGAKVKWETGHLAHIVSRGAGGPDTPENTYCCCAEHHLTFHQFGPSMEKPVPCKPKNFLDID